MPVNKGWSEYIFNPPFPNECLFATVMESGVLDYEGFTVGHITKERINIYTLSGRTGSDSIIIFALGY